MSSLQSFLRFHSVPLLLPLLLLGHLSALDSTIARDAAVDPYTDCALRNLCVDFARHLQPAIRPPGGSRWDEAAADALQLWNCTKTRIVREPEARRWHHHWKASAPTNPVSPPLSTFSPLFASIPASLSSQCDPARSWFLSPSGSDSHNGSIISPFASLTRALSASRSIPALPGRCIVMREGTYHVAAGGAGERKEGWRRQSQWGGLLALTADDSGLFLTSYEDERVVLSGGVPLIGLQWSVYQQLEEGTVYSTPLPADLDLRWLASNELYVDGVRAIRAKYPNGDPSSTGRHTKPSSLLPPPEAAVPPQRFPLPTDLLISSPSRNHSVFPFFQLGIGGAAAVFDPPANFWSSSNPPKGDQYAVPSGLIFPANLTSRINRWKQPHTGLVHAFHGGYWGNWVFAVAAVNISGRQLSFARGGWQEARGSGDMKEWYVSNLLEELDSPNEWYIDRDNRILFFMPNTTTDASSSSSSSIAFRVLAALSFVLSQKACILSIRASPSRPTSSITVHGLTFAHTANTFLQPFEVPSGGDWSLHRGGAVFITGGREVTVDGCLFTQLGGSAVIISDWNINVTVQNSEFTWLGDSGVVIVGSTSLIDGVTNTNQPDTTTVQSNLFHDTGIYIKQSSPIFHGVARSSRLIGNALFNCPRAAINVNDGFAGGTIIGYNVGFNAVRETSDHGVINTWDRQPYLTASRSDQGSLVPTYNVIHHNCLLNNYYSVYPIDHDDGSAYYLDHSNALIYSGKKSYLGHSKHDRQQLIIYPDLRITQGQGWCFTEQDPRPGQSGWGESYVNNDCVLFRSGQPAEPYYLWNCNSSNLYVPRLSDNRFYVPAGGDVVFPCALGYTVVNLTLRQWQAMGLDLGSEVREAPPVDILVGWAKKLLGMEEKNGEEREEDGWGG